LERIGVSLRRGRGASPQTAVENLLVDGVLPAHSAPARLSSIVTLMPGMLLPFVLFVFFLFASFAILAWTFALRH
jgi:hypothetical protein